MICVATMLDRHVCSLVLLALLMGAASCGETLGRPVLFEIGLEVDAGDDDDPASFSTATGWEVELEQAVIAVGPIYLYENRPIASVPDDASEWGLQALVSGVGELLLPTAHAHAGDNIFDGGVLKGEMLHQIAFDLLAAPSRVGLGTARGIAGPVGSFSVILWEPTGQTLGATDALGDYHAYVSGTASKDGQTIAFEGGVVIPDIGVNRRVDGLAADFELDDDGLFIVSLDPAAWFDSANFELLLSQSEPDDQGRYALHEDTQVAIAWTQALRRPRSWSGRWEPDAASLAEFPLAEGIEP